MAWGRFHITSVNCISSQSWTVGSLHEYHIGRVKKVLPSMYAQDIN
jgi:hypothetical protein